MWTTGRGEGKRIEAFQMWCCRPIGQILRREGLVKLASEGSVWGKSRREYAEQMREGAVEMKIGNEDRF